MAVPRGSNPTRPATTTDTTTYDPLSGKVAEVTCTGGGMIEKAYDASVDPQGHTTAGSGCAE